MSKLCDFLCSNSQTSTWRFGSPRRNRVDEGPLLYGARESKEGGDIRHACLWPPPQARTDGSSSLRNRFWQRPMPSSYSSTSTCTSGGCVDDILVRLRIKSSTVPITRSLITTMCATVLPLKYPQTALKEKIWG